MPKRIAFLAAFLLLGATHAGAAPFTADITDQNGKPAPNTVVSLIPVVKAGMPAASASLALEKTIDQNDETFVPLVTIIPKGGRIVFTNNDRTTHQVYSFSQIKQFELTISHGQTSKPVQFDAAGVSAIGCNIHDKMIAYAYVAESPWTAMTDANGKLRIADVPAGDYVAEVWNPWLAPGRAAPAEKLRVAANGGALSTSIRLLAQPTMNHSHGGDY